MSFLFIDWYQNKYLQRDYVIFLSGLSWLNHCNETKDIPLNSKTGHNGNIQSIRSLSLHR